MNRFTYLLGALFLIITSCSEKEITIETLLHEMTNKSALTYFPDRNYSLKQFSSYDRKTISPENNDWWANADYTQFIRKEENEGRREFVLFDADGPGAVVRYWMTFAGEGAADGTLRIYIDGNLAPVLTGNVLDIISGSKLAPEPLATSVSPETEYQRRGHNLYLPIPYAQHCKITYECDAVKFENNRWRPSIYYNICYRTYEPNTKIESFSMPVLERAKSVIEETAQTLLQQKPQNPVAVGSSKILAPNDSLVVKISQSGKSISAIMLKLDADDIQQALRSTVLSVSFDGNHSVWVPAGDFFGSGYQIFPSKTWYTEVKENGWMLASWVMPFRKNAEIKLINYGNQNVNGQLEISTEDYKWKKSSMYFGASWHEYNRIHTAKDPNLENHEWHFDVNYVDIKGQGVYAGDALTVFNTVDAWWGEGDEKIFVDGEDFPSFIGTGTEDYYGYAWCRPEKFSHPFIAQPAGAGNFHPGMTVNMRYRSLDAIPFQQNINSNIEMWHWVKTKINFAMTSFWYARPGFQINVKPDQEIVKIPVALKRTDIYPPKVDEHGKIEGEYLEVMYAESGNVSTQSGDYGWSNEGQLWWRDADTGSELATKFILSQSGEYKISAQFTKAVDYGIVQFYLNGIPVGDKFNGFNSDGVVPVELNLGTQIVGEGENIFSVKIVGADKRSKPGNMVGIDYIQFSK